MKIVTTRAETFSDGVIAIIITIMVLSLKIPDINRETTAPQLYRHLQLQIPYLIAYAFSFMMIGIFWTNHHHLFHLLERLDERLLWQNLLFLFWVSLIPITTAVVGASPSLPFSSALYGFVMLMTTLSFALMRHYTLKKGLIHKDHNRTLTKNIYRLSLRARTKSFLGALAYLLSIPLAYVNVYLAYLCFVIPPIIFFIPDGIDDEKLAEKITEKNT